MNLLQEIKFCVHDEEHAVKISDVKPETTLNHYLRQKAHLTGTKNMCFEGGCGTCIVSVSAKHPVTNKTMNFAVNSCLVSIFSCHGWKIQTIEGIGNPLNGFHKIQKTLAHFNGTQCGFCTPGMVMNMYALLEENPNITMKEMENSFGGNLCRCTGYRPILSAFKSLCKDVDPALIGTVVDIEDLRVCHSDAPCKEECKQFCFKKEQICFDLGDSKWFKVYKIDEIFDIFDKNPKASYMLVSGNTAKGVFKSAPTSDVYVDVTEVKELLEHVVNDKELILGANMSLTETMNLFYKLSAENKNFAYLTGLGDHIDLIANVPVRNTGSLAGNLTMKHGSHGFPSDIYLILETVRSTIRTIGKSKAEMSMNLVDYLNVDMKHRVIKNIVLPALDGSYVYRSYKIMPRAQNAHAIVNAGFLVKLNDSVVETISIVYGNINPKFIHATETETFLVGKKLFDNSTLLGAYKTLEKEINPDHILPDPAPEFRRKLAIALFYKFVLSIAPESVLSPRNKTGGNILERSVTKGSQDYETNESLYPLTQAIPKIEALAQTSGQAEYINDFPDRPGQLYAAFVLSDAAPNSRIKNISPDKALKMKGVVAFYTKDDIPGRNTFTPKESQFPVDEELFCSGLIQYYSQPVGVIVAETQVLAEQAAEMVEITYESSTVKPLFTVRQILEAGDISKISQEKVLKPIKTGTDIKHTIKGKFDISWQYHFHMETQCCSVVPTEDGFNMYPSTQSMDQVHVAASVILNLPANKFNIFVRRLGGAYGGKISRSAICASAAVLAAYKLRKPVKIWLPLEVNMQVIGKRLPCSSDYEVAVNDDGIIQFLNSTIYSDCGKGGNEYIIGELFEMYTKNYINDSWHVVLNNAKTDTPAGTWCRAPGTTEGLAMIESLMEHIAYSINKDPLEIRLMNIDQTKEDKLLSFIDEIKMWAEIDKRKKEIAEFNKNNRWIKKGISVVPMKYPLFNFGSWPVIVAVYQSDGSVSVAHGGIEMGQGINTKVAQVCAYALSIPLEKVSVKPSNNLISPNGYATGASVTSEAVCYGILKACDILLERIKPIREKLNNPTWEAVVKQCYLDFIDLTATFMYAKNLPEIKDYFIYGMCAAEVEVDILTGKYLLTRVDLLEDTGNSMSPEIDIGQVEGAFVMGQGYWTTEEMILSEKGEMLSKNTWTYKPPGAKDIPLDFRVKFPKNNPNPVGILKTKAVAEPPLCMSCSVPLAIRNAVASARTDSNPNAEKWYPIHGPSTVENTFVNSLHDYNQYVL